MVIYSYSKTKEKGDLKMITKNEAYEIAKNKQ